MTWLDMSTAPLGKLVTVTRTVKGELKNYDEYHVAPIWIATSKGGVQRSYWVPATKTSEGRWAGFSAGSDEPMAWQEFVVPLHPDNAGSSSGRTTDFDSVNAGSNPAPVVPLDHLFLEDVGGSI